MLPLVLNVCVNKKIFIHVGVELPWSGGMHLYLAVPTDRWEYKAAFRLLDWYVFILQEFFFPHIKPRPASQKTHVALMDFLDKNLATNITKGQKWARYALIAWSNYA